jgi:ring-1,2-phenylacetyl-CoA epoxidase subunit PaaD
MVILMSTPNPRISLLPIENYERLKRREESDLKAIWNLLDVVKDPEIPPLSIWDLGVLQDITQTQAEIRVTITPTYSGCPAMQVISEDITTVLNQAGCGNVKVAIRLAPAWTTDWLSESARERLRQYGVAPPQDEAPIFCPICSATEIRLISEFGSTPCKALYQCKSCQEPFDYFKPI